MISIFRSLDCTVWTKGHQKVKAIPGVAFVARRGTSHAGGDGEKVVREEAGRPCSARLVSGWNSHPPQQTSARIISSFPGSSSHLHHPGHASPTDTTRAKTPGGRSRGEKIPRTRVITLITIVIWIQAENPSAEERKNILDLSDFELLTTSGCSFFFQLF